jgi:hypothetical protein
MHYLVRIIGEAQTPYAASDNASDIADALVERGEFDYYNPGSDRFDESGSTVPLTSEAGKLAVEAAQRYSRAEFLYAIGLVRRMLAEFSDEQIYQEDFPEPNDGSARDYHPSRHHLYLASGHGNSVLLYGDSDFWGGRIHNDYEYAEAMDGVDQSTPWVTSLDMHQ